MDYLNLFKLRQNQKAKAVILSLICTSSFLCGGAKASAQKVTLEVIKSLLPEMGQSSALNTKGCAFNQKSWLESLLSQKSFNEEIIYNKKCDLKGSYQVTPHKFFPISLDIRNHKAFKSIQSEFKYGVAFEDKPTLTIEMQKAVLAGAKPVTFKFHYQVYVNPLADDPLQEHKGGSLTIFTIGNKKVNKTYKLKFK